MPRAAITIIRKTLETPEHVDDVVDPLPGLLLPPDHSGLLIDELGLGQLPAHQLLHQHCLALLVVAEGPETGSNLDTLTSLNR